MTLPKIGRYRLFRWASPRRQLLRCRLCRHTLKPESQWMHLATELKRAGCTEPMAHFELREPHAYRGNECWATGALEERLAFLNRARRSKRNLAHARFVHAAGSSPDWRDRQRAFGGKKE